MTRDPVRRHQVGIRLDDRRHAELAKRARAAGVPAATLAHDLVVHALDHPAGVGPELLGRIEDLHAFASEAQEHLRIVSSLPERIDRIRDLVARAQESREAADRRRLIEQLLEWAVRAAVSADGLAHLAIPDAPEYREFHRKMNRMTREIVTQILEESDAQG